MELVFWCGVMSILGKLAYEDYRSKWVSDWWMLGLGIWGGIGKAWLGFSWNMVWGCLMGAGIGIGVIVIGMAMGAVLSEEDLESESLVDERCIGFIPSLFFAIVLWLGVLPREEICQQLMWVKWVLGEMMKIPLCIGICLFIGIMLAARVLMVYRKYGYKDGQYGFGEGDVLLLIILGGILGWEGILAIFSVGIGVGCLMAGRMLVRSKIKI